MSLSNPTQRYGNEVVTIQRPSHLSNPEFQKLNNSISPEKLDFVYKKFETIFFDYLDGLQAIDVLKDELVKRNSQS